ncbi:MAG: tetratricopeptide repeat protein [Fimbriimonadaceae bacterium]
MQSKLADAKQTFLAGKFEEAITAFRSVLDEQPACTEAFLGLGFALHADGRATEAIEVFQAGLNRCPNHPELHFGYGLALMTISDEYRAVREFKRTLELEPAHKLCPALLKKALRIHTDHLLEEGNFIWAEQMIEDQLALDEHSPDALAQMIKLKNKLSEYDEAKRLFRILNEKKPDYPGIYDLAKVLGIMKHRERGWLY